MSEKSSLRLFAEHVSALMADGYFDGAESALSAFEYQAEERGRRRGYGQCRDDAAAAVDAAFCAGKWEGLYAKIQNLAPRDSAPAKRVAQHGNWDDADLAEDGK